MYRYICNTQVLQCNIYVGYTHVLHVGNMCTTGVLHVIKCVIAKRTVRAKAMLLAEL